jgi:hypothetical protein
VSNAPGIPTTIPLGDKPYATPYYSLGSEICQNLYMENAQSENSKAQYYLLKTPGLKRFGAIPTVNYGACRCNITTTAGRTFLVFGNRLVEILPDGSQSLIGSLNAQSVTGPVSACENGNLLFLVDGYNGYILRYTDNNLTAISDPYFPGVAAGTITPTCCTYLDTYFIVNVPGTNQYYWSTSYYMSQLNNTGLPYPIAPIDPATQPDGYWTPLQSGAKIGKSDNISWLINCNNYLWLFGEDNSCEVHYDTDNYNGQLFARYQGAIINVGCKAKNSVATYQNNIFFLGTDIAGTLGVFSNDGMSPLRISTRGIEQLIETMGTWSDCQAFTYAQSGHAFYVMHFPTANRTLVYDAVTNAWHERTSLIQSTGLLARWRGMYASSSFDKIIMGDPNSSAVYALDPTYFQNDNPMDAGINYIRCVKTTPINFASGVNVIYNWVQVICNQGSGSTVDNVDGVGTDPHLQLAWSDDTGLTWSNERSAPIGRQGQYANRTRVLGCGMGRNRVFRIAMTDPVHFILVALMFNGNPCRF